MPHSHANGLANSRALPINFVASKRDEKEKEGRRGMIIICICAYTTCLASFSNLPFFKNGLSHRDGDAARAKKPTNSSARLSQRYCHTEKAEARCMWLVLETERRKKGVGKGPKSNRTTQSFSLMTWQYKILSDRMTRNSAILGAS